jgi:hypothetical protein
MPTNLSVFGTPIGAPATGVQREFEVTLYEADGTTLATSKTGLWWAWWSTVAAVRSGVADASGTGATTDGSGVFTVNAPNYLTVGTNQGFGIISDQDATPDSTEAAYTGTFDVV